eukprot:evm.model.NODE_19778_length_9076_cov_24.741627.2
MDSGSRWGSLFNSATNVVKAAAAQAVDVMAPVLLDMQEAAESEGWREEGEEGAEGGGDAYERWLRGEEQQLPAAVAIATGTEGQEIETEEKEHQRQHQQLQQQQQQQQQRRPYGAASLPSSVTVRPRDRHSFHNRQQGGGGLVVDVDQEEDA